MNVFKKFGWPIANGICYSGFRDGQRPGVKYPTYNEIKEDLLLLHGHWKYLRLYDCDNHAAITLNVIEKEGFDFQVMLGAYIDAEMNNHANPWGGGIYEEEKLLKNRFINEMRIQRLVDLAGQYPGIINCLSVGNEACVDWTDHLVPVERVIEFVEKVRKSASQPVTFCENYVPWQDKLKPLAEVLDFISIHTYPVWEYKDIHEAIEYTIENFMSVARVYPDKPIVISEGGWATQSNGKGIDPEKVNMEAQKRYFEDLMAWSHENQVLIYFFEAFDENWKGSDHPHEPEKHWGVFRADRTPKLVVKHLIP